MKNRPCFDKLLPYLKPCRVLLCGSPCPVGERSSRRSNSNLTQWVDSAATCSRPYDADNRPTSEVVNNVTSVSWSWDGTGQKGLLSSLTDSGSRTLTLGYTTRNELATVQDSDGTATSLFDADGDESQLTLQNGAVVSRTFDEDDRLTDVINKTSTGTTLSSVLYTLDNDSRRAGVTEADGSTVTWGYDGASRLTSEVRTGTNPYSISYTLDGSSNRTEVNGTATTNLSYDKDDELNSTSSTTGGFVNSYSYNANGEQTGRTLGGTAYTLAFDYDGQISTISQGTSTVSFGYDALGRRVSRTAGGTTTDFQLLGQYFPLLEKQGSTTTAAYTYGNELVRMNGDSRHIAGIFDSRWMTAAAPSARSQTAARRSPAR